MTPAVCHFAGRVREAVGSPRLLLAGLACGVFAMTLDPGFATHLRLSLVLKMFSLSYIGGFASVIGPGATSSPGQGRFWSTRFLGVDTLDWAHPPLPLGPKSRILVESLAAVGIILLWRVILEPVYLLALPGGSSVGVPGFLWDRLVEACLIVPCAVAWMSPSRFRAVHVIRILAIGPLVAVWSLFAPRLGTWSWGVVAVVLTLGLLEFSQVRLHLTMPFRGRTRSGALVRRSRPPASQLRRDLWLGPLKNNLLLTACTVVALAAFAVAHGMPKGQSFLAGVVLGLSGAFLFLPLGVPLLGRQDRRGGTPLFGGWFVRAWAALPVRRDALLRGVYAHGLIWGGGLSLFWMTLPDLDDRWLIAPVGLAASVSVGGALVCAAVGDKWRGMLSTSAAALALGAGPLAWGLDFLFRVWIGWPPVAIAIAAIAGGLGGLPPLVHLVPRRAPNT